ncbi:GCN5-related N-acetyltransferase [Hyella patelloides LEGE 07179]|uniref:GCN5-related N-acetyltransferase n=1 Tax=Hyella patelloides LEGE 07179 TaxID=945734 RepID=A0A563VV32_9CYAN|nr:GNAT family N-acetyltransferase [Hyella patelloides]VEP15270.1 GCN5-related N-acetyltransferase [Hyella patelloides LEGE 07179]
MLIETERLILRMFRESDFEDYLQIFSDPEVTRYIGNGKAMARPEAWMSMAAIFGHWQLRGYGILAVEERSSKVVVGRIGFLNPEGWPGFELCWILNRNYWGQGYATEGAKALLDYGFRELKREHIVSLIHPGNTRSIRVAEKLGEQLQDKTEVYGKEVLVYGIDRSAFDMTNN